MNTIEIFLWCGIFALSSTKASRNFEYRFEYAVFVGEVKNHTAKPPADVHICELNDEEKLRICKEATTDPLVKTTKIDFVEGPSVGEEKVYEFTLGGFDYRGKPPLVEPACPCPTNPLMYLRDKSVGNAVDAFVSIRESYDSKRNRD